jgi:glutamyl-tRNA synthetase
MHVGGVRTALFAWLVARQNNGSFVLRIEDTDKEREVEGSEKHIINTLRSLNLDYDEGPGKEGPYGPYRQSQRLDIYREWAKRLIKEGRAYADPYSVEELNNFREQSKISKKPFLFREHRPTRPTEWDGTQPLRFLSEPKDYSWHDEIMGDLKSTSSSVDDFIIIKSDGYPTYNFAHIVDDYLMKISHIIRGQEFLASVPKYLNLYEALAIDHPKFATVPFVLAPDGKRKLSKRDGAKDVLEYIKEGYLPETLLNFIASLGWNDGTEKEIFTVDELITKFKINQVQKSGARFDERRLLWMNGYHLRSLNLDDLYARSINYWPQSSHGYSEEYKKNILKVIQERLKYLSEIDSLTKFFFEDRKVDNHLITNDNKLKDIPSESLKNLLIQAKECLDQSTFTLEDITIKLNDLLIQTDQKPAVLFSLIRIAVTQSASSPRLFETIFILGKERTIRRIDKQISVL